MKSAVSERVFTAGFAIFSIYLVWQSYSYGLFSSTITGAGFFPAIAAAIMLISALVSLLSSTPAKPAQSNPAEPNVATAEAGSPRSEFGRAMGLVVLTGLLILLAPKLGLIAVTPFYVFGCFLVLTPDFKPARLLRGAFTAVAFTLVAWAVFVKALGVPMPHGPW